MQQTNPNKIITIPQSKPSPQTNQQITSITVQLTNTHQNSKVTNENQAYQSSQTESINNNQTITNN